MPRQRVAGVDLGPDGDLITTGRAKALVAAVVAQDIAEQAKLVQSSLDEVQRHLAERIGNESEMVMVLLRTLEASLLAHVNMASAEFRAHEARTVRGRVRRAVNAVRERFGYTALKPAWTADPSRFTFSLMHSTAKVTDDPDMPASPFDTQFMRPMGARPQAVE